MLILSRACFAGGMSVCGLPEFLVARNRTRRAQKSERQLPLERVDPWAWPPPPPPRPTRSNGRASRLGAVLRCGRPAGAARARAEPPATLRAPSNAAHRRPLGRAAGYDAARCCDVGGRWRGRGRAGEHLGASAFPEPRAGPAACWPRRSGGVGKGPTAAAARGARRAWATRRAAAGERAASGTRSRGGSRHDPPFCLN